MYSGNDKYRFAAKGLFKDLVFETRENFITTVKIANQNVAALVDTGCIGKYFKYANFYGHQQQITKTLEIKKNQNKSMHLRKI